LTFYTSSENIIAKHKEEDKMQKLRIIPRVVSVDFAGLFHNHVTLWVGMILSSGDFFLIAAPQRLVSVNNFLKHKTWNFYQVSGVKVFIGSFYNMRMQLSYNCHFRDDGGGFAIISEGRHKGKKFTFKRKKHGIVGNLEKEKLLIFETDPPLVIPS
jgi:hypothetical protein